MARTLLITIKDNTVAEEFARQVLRAQRDGGYPFLPRGAVINAMVARPTLACKCQRKRVDGWTRAPRFGWFVHASCRRPSSHVVRHFIRNMLGNYKNLLNELTGEEPEPFSETQYKVPDMTPAEDSVPAILTTAEAIVEIASESTPDTKYLLEYRDGKWTCPCLGFQFQEGPCKHIPRAEEIRRANAGT